MACQKVDAATAIGSIRGMRLSTDQFGTSNVSKHGAASKATSANVGRFYFNSLNMPVRAKVMHQDAAGMTLRQELPFLELNGKLRDEDGREGSLENVSVCVRNGVPSLVLDVRYDNGRPDATVPFLMESTRAMRATKGLLNTIKDAEDVLPAAPTRGLRRRREETLSYGLRPHRAAAETPVMPSVEELLNVTSAPLAPRPRHSQPNGWWARMCRRFVAFFR